MTRQIYMFISLNMKCQQLQMKLLNSQNSNKNSLLFTKGTCFCSSKRLLILWVLNFPRAEFLIGFLCKKQTWSLFSAIQKSRHGHLCISILTCEQSVFAFKILFQKLEHLRTIHLSIFSFAQLFHRYHQRQDECRFT